MRNIPKYHTTKQLQNGQVLKFDIRNPDPCRQLWNRRLENTVHATHECLIETMHQIREKEKQAEEQNDRKRTRATEMKSDNSNNKKQTR